MDCQDPHPLTDDFVSTLREFAAQHELEPLELVSVTASSLCLMSVAWRPTGELPTDSRELILSLVMHYLQEYEALLAGVGPRGH